MWSKNAKMSSYYLSIVLKSAKPKKHPNISFKLLFAEYFIVTSLRTSCFSVNLLKAVKIQSVEQNKKSKKLGKIFK